MSFADDAAVTWRFGKSMSRHLKNLANQILLNWLISQIMVAWELRDFKNY